MRADAPATAARARTRTPFVLMALAASIAVLLAGCSGGGGSLSPSRGGGGFGPGTGPTGTLVLHLPIPTVQPQAVAAKAGQAATLSAFRIKVIEASSAIQLLPDLYVAIAGGRKEQEVTITVRAGSVVVEIEVIDSAGWPGDVARQGGRAGHCGYDIRSARDHADPRAVAGADAHADANTYGHSSADANTDAYSDSVTDAFSHAIADADANTHSDTHRHTSLHPQPVLALRRLHQRVPDPAAPRQRLLRCRRRQPRELHVGGPR